MSRDSHQKPKISTHQKCLCFGFTASGLCYYPRATATTQIHHKAAAQMLWRDVDLGDDDKEGYSSQDCGRALSSQIDQAKWGCKTFRHFFSKLGLQL